MTKPAVRRRRPGPQLPSVDEATTPLQKMVVRRMQELGQTVNAADGGWPLTYGQVAERAAAGGYVLSESTMTNVINKNARLQNRTVAALAFALSLDEDTVRRAMTRSLAGMEMRIPAKIAKQLTADGWAQLLEFAEYLVSKDGNG